MQLEWRISVKDNSVLLFMNYTKQSETGGMDSGCSKVIAQGKITTTLIDLKRQLWDSVKNEYKLGEFKE